MIKGRIKKIAITSLFLFLILFSSAQPIYAAITPTDIYGGESSTVDVNLEKKQKNSVVLEALALFVNAMGSMIENLVGKAFEAMTGVNSFPWADKVIYNTIPFLDINFLNPANRSLFSDKDGNETTLATIIRNTYFTVLVIAIFMLSVLVGIMAIRLAISTIASEKARYKQSLVSFLFSLVMLFTVHYLISFIFYVNEQMVAVAASILSDNLKETVDFNFQLNDDETVSNFLDKQDKNVLGELFELSTKLEVYSAFASTAKDWKPDFDECSSIISDEKNRAVAANLLRDDEFGNTWLIMADGGNASERSFLQNITAVLDFLSDEGDYIAMMNLASVIKLAQDKGAVKNANEFIKLSGKKNGLVENATWVEALKLDTADPNSSKNKKKIALYKSYAQAIVNSSKIFKGKSNGSSNVKTIISDMGAYFKSTAYTYETDEEGAVVGWRANEISFQGALLYAVFVIQSMLFFFAYIKRFFYVVILALLAPAIVLYDFLGKMAS